MVKTHQEFLAGRETASPLNARLKIFIREYRRYKSRHHLPLRLLDVGCGRNPVLFPYKAKDDYYHGCDFYSAPNVTLDGYSSLDFNVDSLTDVLGERDFDVVFCGEVIEHLFSPDALIDEIKQLMHSDSILILSTPNLAYYVNRVLLLFGISPLLLENSAEVKLGRRFKWLGQDNVTEGHIRLFTHGALMDFLDRNQFDVLKVVGTPVWNFPLDALVSRVAARFAPDLVVLARRREQPSLATSRAG